MVFRQNWGVVAHAALSNAILHDDEYDNDVLEFMMMMIMIIIMMMMMMMMVHK